MKGNVISAEDGIVDWADKDIVDEAEEVIVNQMIEDNVDEAEEDNVVGVVEMWMTTLLEGEYGFIFVGKKKITTNKN